MYYSKGEIRTKFITVEGYKFRIKATRMQFSIKVELMDRYEQTIEEVDISDEHIGIDNCRDFLEQSVISWIDNNTDESDRIMNKVMAW